MDASFERNRLYVKGPNSTPLRSLRYVKRPIAPRVGRPALKGCHAPRGETTGQAGVLVVDHARSLWEP
jgi:hypothetical protein